VDKINKYDNLGTIDKLLAGTMLEDGTVIDSEFTQHRQNLTDNNLVLTPKGTVFTRDKQGFIPAIMKFLFEERKVYKTKMLKAKDGKEHAKTPEEKKIFEQQISEYNAKQNALKVLLNGGYGALANVHFRWFDYNIAESITLTGQYIIRCTEKHMNLFLNKILKTTGVDYVVAVDTDSNYINVTKVVDKMFPNGGSQEDITIFLEKFAVQVETYAIDEAFKEIYHSTNAFDECLHMKLEAIGQAVWKAAKMYIMAVWSMEGVRYAVPDIKMQGIEAVRSSTPEICRKYIKDSLPFIVAKDEKGLKEHILKCEEEFFKQPFHRVAKPGGVTEITKWEDNNTIYKKGVPYHVRAAITYNNLVRKKGLDGEMPLINNGDKMRLCYMTMPNPLRENVFACPDELPEEFGVERYIDYVTQFYKTFKKPITGLTDAAGISISDKMDMDQFY
jgi:hypothetical protein